MYRILTPVSWYGRRTQRSTSLWFVACVLCRVYFSGGGQVNTVLLWGPSPRLQRWWMLFVGLFVGCLLNVPATCVCISWTDLHRQFYVLPHWDSCCRSNFLPHPATVYWHRTDQPQRWPYNARRLAGQPLECQFWSHWYDSTRKNPFVSGILTPDLPLSRRTPLDQRGGVRWLLNAPATGYCTSGADLLRQSHALPHWDRSCINFLSHPVTVYWSQADLSQLWQCNNTRGMAG